MNTQTRRLAAGLAVLAIGLASLGGDCDGDIVNDPTFRDWCGDTLCAWQVNPGGMIARVATWDANDLGVSFVTTNTEIFQVTATTQTDATCLLFTSVANIDPTAMMTLEVDFDDDGTIDYSAQLGATDWQRVEEQIPTPATYSGIRFILLKAGTGTAVLAELRIQSTSTCTAAAPPLSNLPLGATCSEGSQCESGICGTSAICSQCTPDEDGGASQCSKGVACASRSFVDFSNLSGQVMPYQCGPGQGLGLPGAPCLAGDDCKSGQCSGAGADPTSDAGPCDLEAVDAAGSCENYVVHGGQCM
jgi:hypothetical protein